MKIFLTGASGYVGARVYKFLKDCGYDVVGTCNSNKLFDDLIQVDITDKDDLRQALSNVNPNIIIHTAADAHTGTCEKDPENARKLNVEATKFIVEYAKKNSA